MKLSIIIPTLNEETVIEKLLKNLKDIHGFDYEVIVSDGKSTDRTVEIAKSLGAKVVENPSGKRQTIGEGRNAGAAVATGDYFVFLDADVYLGDPNRFFARALDNFAKDKKLLGLSGWVRVFPEMETWGDILGYVIVSDCMFYLLNNILRIGSTCGEFQMIKADVFKRLRGFREDLVAGEDKDLFYRISRLGHTRTDPKLLILHTGRRPHAIGWPSLLWLWAKESLHITFFNRSHGKEWKVIR